MDLEGGEESGNGFSGRLRSMTCADEEAANTLLAVIMSLTTPTHESSQGLQPLPHQLINSTFYLDKELCSNPHLEPTLPLEEDIAADLASYLPPHPNTNLYPMRTDGDGNCLLHSASLSMFGTHDRGNILRSLLTQLLSKSVLASTLETAWREAMIAEDSSLSSFGIPTLRTPQTLQKEYSNTLEIGAVDKSYLGSFHILSLSHIIRRPIIVYSSYFIYSKGGGELCVNTMRGVYLPLAIPPSACNKTPICLCFTSKVGGNCGHFTSLIYQKELTFLPLVDLEGRGLEVRYSEYLARGGGRGGGGEAAGGATTRKKQSSAVPSRKKLLASYMNIKIVNNMEMVIIPKENITMLKESENMERKFVGVAKSMFEEAEV
ncbi:hypothetical protein TrLO_g7473 [Triparma laevis f. longispina]|uniref:OTU domain-containing protein n=1 Tax=Triparma laevis f. longispina TaxID=1714387 RepID=A0A9W7FG85_9STRA|nr:hypothetical protein TrLO_g7473 [Triparma laevis f. longispina]